jgi:hypothetical protein
MLNAPQGGALAQTGLVDSSVPDTPVTTLDRPLCGVVGVYCESLGWLRREPACPASVCCRHFWANAEAVSAHG